VFSVGNGKAYYAGSNGDCNSLRVCEIEQKCTIEQRFKPILRPVFYNYVSLTNLVKASVKRIMFANWQISFTLAKD